MICMAFSINPQNNLCQCTLKMKVLVGWWLCDPMDCGLPGSSVHGILQARILEWVAIPFSRGSSRHRDQIWVSCITGSFFTNLPSKEAQSTHESHSHSVMSSSLWPHRLYSPWNSPGQNTGLGSLFLLQGIFPTQGLNPGLPHCRRILYQLSHQGSPRILEWVSYPFSSGSSRPRDWTGVSCIAGRFFTNWAIREAQSSHSTSYVFSAVLDI